MTTLQVPLIIRGKVIEDYEVEFGGRGGNMRFMTPDVKKYMSEQAWMNIVKKCYFIYWF